MHEIERLREEDLSKLGFQEVSVLAAFEYGNWMSSKLLCKNEVVSLHIGPCYGYCACVKTRGPLKFQIMPSVEQDGRVAGARVYQTRFFPTGQR